MKVGTEDRKKLIAAGTFGVLALGYLVYTFVGSGGTDSPPTAPAAVVAGDPATPARSISPVASTRSLPSRLDPSLHPEGMLLTESLVYTGVGRNIFQSPDAAAAAAAAAAPKIPVPLASARYVPPVNMGPAPPPPIDLRFFGTATRHDGVRQAFLLRGDDVFVASTGDVVSRRYRVGAISLTTVEVTDLTNSNTQRLTMSPQ
jgi:hypothetical protein